MIGAEELRRDLGDDRGPVRLDGLKGGQPGKFALRLCLKTSQCSLVCLLLCTYRLSKITKVRTTNVTYFRMRSSLWGQFGDRDCQGSKGAKRLRVTG